MVTSMLIGPISMRSPVRMAVLLTASPLTMFRLDEVEQLDAAVLPDVQHGLECERLIFDAEHCCVLAADGDALVEISSWLRNSPPRRSRRRALVGIRHGNVLELERPEAPAAGAMVDGVESVRAEEARGRLDLVDGLGHLFVVGPQTDERVEAGPLAVQEQGTCGFWFTGTSGPRSRFRLLVDDLPVVFILGEGRDEIIPKVRTVARRTVMDFIGFLWPDRSQCDAGGRCGCQRRTLPRAEAVEKACRAATRQELQIQCDDDGVPHNANAARLSSRRRRPRLDWDPDGSLASSDQVGGGGDFIVEVVAETDHRRKRRRLPDHGDGAPRTLEPGLDLQVTKDVFIKDGFCRVAWRGVG